MISSMRRRNDTFFKIKFGIFIMWIFKVMDKSRSNCLIVSRASAEDQSIENMTPEISLTVLKTFKGFVYLFIKLIACDHE